MKTVLIFGAGQVGAMVSRLMGGEYRVLCFADNSVKKHGVSLAGVPILSPEDGLRLKPDCVLLGVLDSQRAEQMERQLRELGYAGELLRPDALKVFDPRVATMRLIAEQIHREGIAGDAAELGVFQGEFAALINAALPDRALLLFDTFRGFDARDVETEQRLKLSRARAGDFSETAEALVLQRLPHPEKAEIYRGFFPDSFGSCLRRRFCFVSIDADLYAPTSAALPMFFDRLEAGGVLMIHDVNSTQFGGAGQAVEEFCRERKLLPTPVCDLHGSVILRKQSPVT